MYSTVSITVDIGLKTNSMNYEYNEIVILHLHYDSCCSFVICPIPAQIDNNQIGKI